MPKHSNNDNINTLRVLPCNVAGELQEKVHCLPKVVPQGQVKEAK